MFEPEVDAALKQLTDQLSDAHPDIKAVMEKLQKGDLTEVEAMGTLMNLVREHGLETEVQRLADGAFGDLRETERGLELHQSADIALGKNGPTPTVLYPTRPDRPGRLNPLYEAHLAERIQFDGDAPELRTGPMPDGAVPAVPVLTKSTNPVAIGRQMLDASEEVATELRIAQQDWDTEAESLTQIAMDDGHDKTTAITLATKELPVPIGVPGYQPGELPALRDTAVPTGAELAALTVEERQEAAFTVLATTQGRRSSRGVIEDLVREDLEAKGFPMTARPVSEGPDSVQVSASWTANISSEGVIQPNFSFINVASKVLAQKLAQQLLENPVVNPVLEVLTIDTYADREVGWAARVVSL